MFAGLPNFSALLTMLQPMVKMSIPITGFYGLFFYANSAKLVFKSGNSPVHPMLNTCILIVGFLILFEMLILRIWFLKW